MNVFKFLFVLLAGVQVYAQNFDLYESQGRKKSKIIVFVHGGAWIGGNKNQYQQLGKKLVEAGFCAAVIDYRLAPGAVHPAQVADLDQALSKLSESKSKNCDGQNLYLIGHSAGAHMIAAWSETHTLKTVKAFVGLEGIYDIPLIAKAFPDYGDWFLKAEFGADEKNWVEASPNRQKIQNKNPWLLVQSEKDELVDRKQTDEFKLHLESEKINTELLLLKEESHFAVAESLQNPNSVLFKTLLKFISKE